MKEPEDITNDVLTILLNSKKLIKLGNQSIDAGLERTIFVCLPVLSHYEKWLLGVKKCFMKESFSKPFIHFGRSSCHRYILDILLDRQLPQQ